MRISVFGLGYVGSVSAACLARDGHEVIGVDVNREKIERINAAKSTVVEPGLEQLVDDVVRGGRLRGTTDATTAVHESDMSVICVGTPSNGNGSLKLDHIENVCREIGKGLASKVGDHVVVVRSTVLPGTTQERLVPLLEEASGKTAGVDFGVGMNPEFLREGSAIEDFDHPSQIVIGELNRHSGDVVQQAYSAIDAEIVRTSIRTAEMIKYVNNAFHALKVVFANEIGNLCKAHEIDGQEVMEIFCQDRRLNISPNYLRPGFAFGGSCLPKDLRALVYQAKVRDVSCPVLSAVLNSNKEQIARGINMVECTGQTSVGVFGLSFKAGTDDVRESPVVPLIETLVGRGYDVSIYDGMVDPSRLVGANKAFLERELPHIASLMRNSIDEVMKHSNVLVVTNESAEFRAISKLAAKDQVVIDLVGVGRQDGYKRNGNYEGICW